MLFSIFSYKFTLTWKNHIVYPYAFRILMQKLFARRPGVNALKRADVLPLMRPGLEALMRRGRRWWKDWHYKETSIPDNNVLCHVSRLPLWFYWIFSVLAVNSVWHKHITWSLGHLNPFPIKIELSCPSSPQHDPMIMLAWTLTETGLTEPRL